MTAVRRWLASLAALAALSQLAGCQTLRNATLYLPPPVSGMERVASDVVVETGADATQRAQALAAREQAHRLLSAAVGTVQSSPVHYFCHTDACWDRFGGGQPRAKSFGQGRTLMSPHGLTAAYVAHEWWHAELHARLGFWNWRRVPRWFDEGVAVWVSADPRYGPAVYQQIVAQGIVPPRLQELETTAGFIGAVGRYGDHLKSRQADAVTVVYPTAAHEVRRWMVIVGTTGLQAMLAGLARGESFDSLYTDLEAAASPRPPQAKN